MADYAIETLNLTKRYGAKLAVDHLNLKVPTGSVVAVPEQYAGLVSAGSVAAGVGMAVLVMGMGCAGACSAPQRCPVSPVDCSCSC